MNAPYKVILALLSCVMCATLGAMNLPRHQRPTAATSSSSSSSSQVNLNDFLTKEEQEAIDADIAFTLMQTEMNEIEVGRSSRFDSEQSDAEYARQLQMQYNQEIPVAQPASRPSPVNRDSARMNYRTPRSHGSHGSAIQLPMLPEFKSRAVYHIKTKQIDAFSCGYNVLFNAANFEHHCGFLNEVHPYSVFRNLVQTYLNKIKSDPRAASYNTTTENLARNILNLQPFYHLYKKDGQVEPLLTEAASTTYRLGTPHHEIQNLIKQASARLQQKEIEKIRVILSQNGSAVIHFLCNIVCGEGMRHGVLISLIQNSSGRGLYIFDNLNELLLRNGETTEFIEYLCLTFGVGSSSTFAGPQLPFSWPSLAY